MTSQNNRVVPPDHHFLVSKEHLNKRTGQQRIFFRLAIDLHLDLQHIFFELITGVIYLLCLIMVLEGFGQLRRLAYCKMITLDTSLIRPRHGNRKFRS